MRNLAQGVCIEPSCSLTHEINRQFAMCSFHWQSLYRRLSVCDEDGVLELKQIKIGFHHAFLLFHIKVVGPSELPFEAYPTIVENMLQLADEVVNAGEKGRPVLYLDKLVNAGIYPLGFAVCAAKYRKRTIDILQRQANRRDGLTNRLHGVVIETMMTLEHMSLSWWSNPLAPLRMILSGLSSTNDGQPRVSFVSAITNLQGRSESLTLNFFPKASIIGKSDSLPPERSSIRLVCRFSNHSSGAVIGSV